MPLVGSKQLDEDESIINAKFPVAYASLVNEIKGDILVAKNQLDKAREAYDRAILSAAGQGVEFLKMKRDDLGKTPGEKTENKTQNNATDPKSGA